MYCATLKSQALNTIICHMCSGDKICKSIAESLLQDGIYEMFAKLILQKMVEMYPSFVSDPLLHICCHGNLKEINMKSCKNVSLHALNNAVARCANVERVDVSECDQLVSIDLIHSLEQNAKQLHCLKFDWCSSLTDEILQLAIQRLPQLTELSCEGCKNLNNLPLLKLPLANGSAPLSNLTTVNLSGCLQINCTFIRHLTAITRSNLQSLNISNTGIDCIALVYLSGYSLSSAVNIATNLKNNTTFPFKSLEVTSDDVTKDVTANVVSDNDAFDVELGGHVETLSDYVKKMCAYCSNDLAVRKHSECVDSIKVFSIIESYEDYDIVDSQVVNIIESSQTFEDYKHNCEKEDDDLEWTVLSINDICIDNNEQCTCSSEIAHPEECPKATPCEKVQGCEKEFTLDEIKEKDSTLDKVPNFTPNGNIEIQKEDFTCEPIFIPNITSLDISSTNFYDTGFYELEVVQECFLLFLMSNKNIRNLHISWASEEVTDDMVGLTAEKQPQMESISLAGCVRISNTGVGDIVDKFENLKAIDLSGVSFVTDEPLIQLVTKHTELQYLYFKESCLTDRVLEQISSTLCHSIRHLDLSWCENITDRGVVKLLSSCKKLTYLDLRQCEISVETLRGITQNGRNLTVIGLNGIRGLNDSTCIEMVKNLPNLHRVDFSWNTSITDESILALCHSCPCLREVVISGLKRITSKPFLPIISGLLEWRQTREKILSRLYSQMLPNTYINVRERDVANLEALEPDFYLPFRSVNYVPELRKLTLGYCDKVNDNHLSEIAAVCRNTLMIEDYYGTEIKAKWSDLAV